MLKRDQPILFYYDMTVEDGSVTLEVRSKSGQLFEKTFTESEKASIEIVPTTKFHSIVLHGSHAKGTCHCGFNE